MDLTRCQLPCLKSELLAGLQAPLLHGLVYVVGQRLQEAKRHPARDEAPVHDLFLVHQALLPPQLRDGVFQDFSSSSSMGSSSGFRVLSKNL